MYQIAIYVGSEREVKRFQRFAGVERGPTQAHGELLLPAALDDVANTSTFNFGPSESSAVYFGVSQVGTWQAQVVVSGTLSNIVAGEVLWLPVHVTR